MYMGINAEFLIMAVEFQATIQKIMAQDEGFFAGSFSRGQLLESAALIAENLDQDMARIRKESGILFSPADQNNPGKMGEGLATAFEGWRENPPSITALMMVSADVMGIDKKSPEFSAALLSSIAAEVRNDNAYHSNHHFREVTAMMIRNCVTNNDLAASGAQNVQMMSSESMAKCLTAAAAHDLMHDGKGNSPNGQHEQYRLENQSIHAVEPLMKLAGMSERDQEDIRVMIRVTDITAKPGEMSPHKMLRSALEESFGTGAPGQPPVALPAELSALRGNSELLTMATLMSDADLGPSAGTSYDFSQKQSKLLSQENPNIKAGPEGTIGFLKYVIGDSFSSVAGKTALNGALVKISDTAADDLAKNTKEIGKSLAEKEAPKSKFTSPPKRKNPGIG